mgnify:CR=1 FL=1
MGASWLVADKLLALYSIPSSSMHPTLQINDRVLINKLYPSMIPIQAGDIIVFEDPGSWMSDEEKLTGNTLIKRVIAVGGDTIECCSIEGKVVINDVAIDEPYIDPKDVPSDTDFNETVPEGYIFVMGDNRSESNDSRYQTTESGGKFVPLDNVRGLAFYVLSSNPENHWLPTY